MIGLDTTQLRADLMIAARFLMDDGYSVEHDAAFRIGLSLAELSGMMRMQEFKITGHEKEHGTND